MESRFLFLNLKRLLLQTNNLSHFVKRKTLITTNFYPFIMMLPRSKD